MHKASEKKCNKTAIVLQEILSKLLLINGNIKPEMPHTYKTKKSATKYLLGMFLIFFLVRNRINNNSSRMMLTQSKLRLSIFVKL